MGAPLHQISDKPCEICGDIGWIAAIMICSKCEVTREHLYCMNIMYKGDREKWICEDCDVSNKNASSKLGTGIQFMIRKPPTNSKVQYLTPEEIRVLESGATRNNSLSPSKSYFAHRPSVNKQIVSKTEAIPSSAVNSNLCIKPNPAVESSRNRKPTNNQSMSTFLRDKNLSSWTEKEKSLLHFHDSPVKQSSARVTQALKAKAQKETNGPARQCHGESANAKRVTFEKFPKPGVKSNNLESDHAPLELVQCLAAANSGARQNCGDARTAKGLPVEKYSKNEMNTVNTSPLVQSLPVAISGSDDSKRRESPKVSMVFDIYLPNHPAVSPTWKGTLKIMNDVLPCSSFDEIQAHPPCKVNSKAYKLSKQLPNTLQFEMLPRRNTWIDIFKEYVPSELDIGSYFLHATTSNLNGSYCSLLEYLDGHNLLLRTCINGVELFVFSSKHLPEVSRKINQKHFLWGLFRPSQSAKDKFSVASGEEPLARVNSVSQQALQPISKELEPEDMDVDMVGGHEVGKVDIIVPKYEDHARGDYREGEKGCSNEIETSPMSAAGSLADFSSIKIKREWTDDMWKSPPRTTSFVDDDREFEEELQRSFDRFTALMQLKDSGCLITDIKKEVNA